MKYMNKSMMLVASGMLALASCTEYSDYNTAPEDGNPLANQTLLENISENEQLKDFTTIINKAGCSEILNSSRVFTLWAPADGTYDATPYLNMDSASVMDKFIKQHLAEYSYQVVGGVDTSRIITMNLKHHDFTSSKFDDIEIKDVNIPASNGIMHILNGVSEYRPNLYEYLDVVEDCDSFANYIHQYDTYTIDKQRSVIGPMVNGQQTYKDTVWTKTNSAMKSILNADLENEDSTYTLLIPTNAAWKNVKEQMSASYNYITDFNYVDLSKVAGEISNFRANQAADLGKSTDPVKIDPVFLKDTLMNTNILRNLVYSNTDDRNKPIVSGVVTETDTLFSTSSRKVTSIDNFIKNTVGEMEEMSNGYVRRLSDTGYYPWESYEPILSITKPGRVSGTIDGVEKGEEVQILKDRIDDDMWGEEFDEDHQFLKKWLMPKSSSYLTYFGTDATMISSTGRVEMDFYLKGAMATKYRVFVVFIPETLNNKSYLGVVDKQSSWTFAFSTHTAEGTPTLGFYNKTDGSFSNTSFNATNPSCVETGDEVVNSKIRFVEFDIEVPICYSNTDASPVLFVQNTGSTSARQARNYDRNLRIAGVFCVPYSALDYVKNLKYEK